VGESRAGLGVDLPNGRPILGTYSEKVGVFRSKPSEAGGERAEPTSVVEHARRRDREGVDRKTPAF
jgi:hypothetical protein